MVRLSGAQFRVPAAPVVTQGGFAKRRCEKGIASYPSKDITYPIDVLCRPHSSHATRQVAADALAEAKLKQQQQAAAPQAPKAGAPAAEAPLSSESKGEEETE